jgi:hypothetical protein
MLADRVVLSAGKLTDRVEVVLARTAFARSGVDDLDLTDAAETYRVAGRAALFEIGGVFERVSQIRPTPSVVDAQRIEALAATMRPLLALGGIANPPVFAPGGPVSYTGPWLAAFVQAGQRLGTAATANRLDRGLTATIAQVVIVHWNRLGLSARTQGVLAHAAVAAALPRSVR